MLMVLSSDFVMGQLLLFVALFMAGAALITGVRGLWSAPGAGRKRGRPWQRSVAGQETAWLASRLLTWLLAICLGGAVLYMALLLLAGDFSILYVWKHSATYQTPAQRLTALLAGQEGTLLLWSFLTSLAGVWTAEHYVRRGTPEGKGGKIVHMTVVTVVLGLLLITLRSAPFQSFAAAFPDVGVSTPIEGTGLNPVLLNPWMPLHTLFTFAGYALVSLVFAIGLLQLLRATQGRHAESRLWHRERTAAARWAWLLLSLALLTGVLWAYEEMTFGWYWSWDPVEAATLLIWLVLTAALHGTSAGVGSRRALLLSPFLAALTLVAVVFASFVTRSGLHPSVHAFAGGAAGPYLGLFLLVLFLATGIPALLAWRRASAAGDDRPAMDWATGVLLAGAGLIAWGISYPIVANQWQQRPVDLDTSFFNLSGYLLALVLLFVIGLELPPKATHRRWLPMLGLFLVLTGVAAFVKPVAGLELIAPERRPGAGLLYETLGQASILSLFPPVVYALLAIWERWLGNWAGSTRRLVHESGIAAIHLGVIVAIVGIAMSSLFASTVTVHVNPLLSPAGSKDAITVRIMDYTSSEQVDIRGQVVAQQETVAVEVYAGNTRVAAGQAGVITYPERDMRRHARVMSDRGLLFDTQVIYHGLSETGPAGVPITVRRIPLVNLLWAGLFLFIPGFGLLLGSRLLPEQARRRLSGWRQPVHEAVGALTRKGDGML